MKLDGLKNKRILILGFGREGKDTLLFFRKLFLEKVLGIADLEEEVRSMKSEVGKNKKIKWHLGKNYLKAIKNYDVIIKSPGIPPRELLKSNFNRLKTKITSQTKIFFENCPGKIIGITGTKGKSTTASLVYKILREGGLKAHLVGNIGKPVLNLLFSATPRDIYVYELSSHQLFDLEKSPQIAVLLNIYPEHLDYYRNLQEYVRAKANITLHQTEKDYLIFNSGDKYVREIAKKSEAKKIPILTNYEFITNIRIPLIGKFNLQNIMAAVTVGRIFGISDKKILKAIEKFKPLSHRLEFVGEFRGIKFYNDSLSTVPETAIAAIESLGENLETLLAGGFDRGLSFQKLSKKILASKIKNLILFPETGKRIWGNILKGAGNKKRLPRNFFTNNMKEAISLAYKYTNRGKICLMSPASPSFGLFRDYKERGNLFKKYARELASSGEYRGG